MQEVDFGADLQAAVKEFNIGIGSDKFKFKEGENRIRILSRGVALQNTYTNPTTGEQSTNVKFVTQVWDVAAAALKLAFFGITIQKAIAALQVNKDWAFSEVPMPYDITINAKSAGTKDVEYQVVPSPVSPVPQEALDALAKEKPIEEIVALIQQKQTQTPPSDSLPV
jgi:hypothetical protein